MDNWPSSGRTTTSVSAADADVANSHQKVASSGDVVMATGDAISIETTEAAEVGGARPHRHHGKSVRSVSYRWDLFNTSSSSSSS